MNKLQKLFFIISSVFSVFQQHSKKIIIFLLDRSVSFLLLFLFINSKREHVDHLWALHVELRLIIVEHDANVPQSNKASL